MVAVIAGLLVLWGAAALALDARGGRPPMEARYDAIIVAGCRVKPNGQPSNALRRRAALAVRLWSEGLAPTVVFTGGVGDFPPSEARAAADYAIREGLAPEAAVLEDRSTSTAENARYAAELLTQLGLPRERVLVVTDGYHTMRAAAVFNQHFERVDAAGSRANRSARARGALREVLAVGWYGLTGKLSGRYDS